MLVALTLAPFILAVSKGGAWGWFSLATLACFAVAVASAFAFVAVERRVAVPMLDLAVLRNRVLVGATIAILIGAGTINGLMYLLSLYFQDPSTLGFSPLEAGLATLPATVGLVVIAPLVPKLAARFGGRQVIGVGFAITAGFAAIGFVQPSWRYWRFCCLWSQLPSEWGCPTDPPPLRQRLQSPPSKSERHPAFRIWPAMSAQRATALAATIYATVTANRIAAGETTSEGLSAGLALASWVMAAFSFAGVLMAFVMARHRAAKGTLEDSAAAAAAITHTLPTSATPAPAQAVASE